MWGRGEKQPLPRTKSRLEVKIYKFSAFSGQITPKLSLTHHHIMPLNLYLFTRQLFAFQFETGKYLISGPGVVEWKCFNGFVTWSRVKLSHLFLPTQHLGYSRYASARATLIPDQIIKHPFNWRVYQRLTTATFNFDSKGSGFLLVILGLQMSVVIFFQPLNRLLLAQYVPPNHCWCGYPKPSAEHSAKGLTCGTGLAKSWTPPWSVQSIPLCSAWKGAVEPGWWGVPRAPGNWKRWKIMSDDKQARFNKDSGSPKALEYCFLRRRHEKRKKCDGSWW